MDEETIHKRLKRVADHYIEETIAEAKEKYGDDIDDDFLVQKTSLPVKWIDRSLDKLKKSLHQEYPRQFRYSKQNYFPLGWMQNDWRIMLSFEKCPLLEPLLKYLFNQNRYLRGEELKALVERNDRVTGGKKYEYRRTGKFRKPNYASWVNDKGFYTKVTKSLGCSERNCRRYISAFYENGIIVKLGKVGRGTLYADGYYVEEEAGTRKFPFIRRTKHFIQVFRDFSRIMKSTF